jgi:hypothetical protein
MPVGRVSKIPLKIYDYRNEGTVETFNVEAVVVGGAEGVFAAFVDPNNPKWFYTAAGDDGHWWIDRGPIDRAWLPGMIEALNLIGVQK